MHWLLLYRQVSLWNVNIYKIVVRIGVVNGYFIIRCDMWLLIDFYQWKEKKKQVNKFQERKGIQDYLYFVCARSNLTTQVTFFFFFVQPFASAGTCRALNSEQKTSGNIQKRIYTHTPKWILYTEIRMQHIRHILKKKTRSCYLICVL